MSADTPVGIDVGSKELVVSVKQGKLRSQHWVHRSCFGQAIRKFQEEPDASETPQHPWPVLRSA